MKKFYYPNNLSEDELFLNYWNIKDILIMGILIVINVLIFVFSGIFAWFGLIIVYGFFSAKIKNGYSIMKLIVLYIRYFFIDQLFFIWRDSKK